MVPGFVVLLRVTIFFFTSTALMALLPLVARGLHGGGAGTFTLLLACMGAGAIVAVGFLPRLRRQYSRDVLVLSGATLQSLVMMVIALTHHTWVAVPEFATVLLESPHVSTQQSS